MSLKISISLESSDTRSQRYLLQFLYLGDCSPCWVKEEREAGKSLSEYFSLLIRHHDSTSSAGSWEVPAIRVDAMRYLPSSPSSILWVGRKLHN